MPVFLLYTVNGWQLVYRFRDGVTSGVLNIQHN